MLRHIQVQALAGVGMGQRHVFVQLQLAACIPNFLILESIQQLGGFHAKLLKTKIQWEDGYVIPSKAPGLGVELNEEVALAHPYTGKGLHLDMAQHPLGYY